MTVDQFVWRSGWDFQSASIQNPDLILAFGHKNCLNSGGYRELTERYRETPVVACSTAGEINNESINDNSIVANAIKFQKAAVECACINMTEVSDSLEAGKKLIQLLPPKGLRFVLILSDGQLVNGSDLIQGVNAVLEGKIPVAGGLAGDSTHFEETIVGCNESIRPGNIAAIGFYGEQLNFSFGSNGGWEEFGLTRTVTKSEKNVLYEIDGSNALDLYKKYLGPYADELPGSALLFPLAIINNDGKSELVRTILSIDETKKTMTFAGNIPEGSKVRLMKANLDNLVEAAADAVDNSANNLIDHKDSLSILISCVGRKIIFDDRIDEELEVAREVLGLSTTITGFYSYGEISPHEEFMRCELHNQTMTVTTISETV